MLNYSRFSPNTSKAPAPRGVNFTPVSNPVTESLMKPPSNPVGQSIFKSENTATPLMNIPKKTTGPLNFGGQSTFPGMKEKTDIQGFVNESRSRFKPVEDLVRKPFQGAWNAQEATGKVPLQLLNTPEVQNAVKVTAERTSGTGIVSMIQAADPDKTFQQAYDANRAAQAGDDSKWRQFLYQLGDSAPQTAIGVALNFVPYAGVPLSTAYWTALSASEQVANKGKVESLNPIFIDVIGDRMLGKSLESLFRAPSKTLFSTVAQNFAVEGGTEVAQDLLKYQDAYIRAKTPEEKEKIIKDAKEYFTSGQILMTLGVGGISGAAIGTAGYVINQQPPQPPASVGDKEFVETEGQSTSPAQQAVKDGLTEEQFVKGRGTALFRGAKTSELKATNGDLGNGIYLTEDKSLAKKYAGKDNSVHEYTISKNAKILDHSDIPYGVNRNEYAEQNGFDAIRYKQGLTADTVDFDSNNILIINKDILKTTSQLRAEYQAALQGNVQQDFENKNIVNSGENKSQMKAWGYKKLSNFVDEMVKNKTIFPEDAPILKTIFEEVDDKFLGSINLKESGRLKSTPGNFSIKQDTKKGFLNKTNRLQMQKGYAFKGGASREIPANSEPGKVFVHEFGHAGYYMFLSNEERTLVDKVFKEQGGAKSTTNKNIFRGGLSEDNRSAEYYSKSPQEFFAESFAGYVYENKVPAAKMKPLLQRLAGKFFAGLKRLVNRGNVPAIERMRPLYEKILSGDSSTPLSDFASKEPPSFKQDLQKLIGEMENPDQSVFPSTPPFESNQTPEKTPFEPSALEQQKKPLFEGRKKTPIKERVGWLEDLSSPMFVLDRLGLRDNYIELKKAELEMMKGEKENREQISKWMKEVPSQEGNVRIFNFLDGEKVQLSEKETKVAGEVKQWLETWADRLGLAPEDRITNYITHIFPGGIEIPEEIAGLIRNKIPGEVYNPFLLDRLGAEGYIRDTWKSLEAYSKRANRKVNMDPALANFKEDSKDIKEPSQIDYIEKYIQGVNMRPTPADIKTDNEVKKVFGNLFGPRPVRAITLSIRKMISRAKIAGSAVTLAKNLTQGVNTFSELGATYTTVGYSSLFKKGAGKELEDNGILLNSFAENQTYSAVKKWAERSDKVLFANMNASEFVNRGAAYFGAKKKYLAGKVSIRDVKKALNKDVQKGYSITEEDAVAYGKHVAEVTQFTFGTLDTPLFLSSDMMKTVGQFQTFTLKQQERIIRQVADKEWAKLARYVFGSLLLFQYFGKIVGMSWKDTYPFVKFELPPALQFIQDTWNTGLRGEDKWGNKLSVEQRLKGVGSSLFTNIVPAGAQLKRSYEGFNAVNDGKSTTKGGKFQYKIEKTPINYIRGTLFGKSNLTEAQDFYDKKDQKKAPSSGGSRFTPS